MPGIINSMVCTLYSNPDKDYLLCLTTVFFYGFLYRLQIVTRRDYHMQGNSYQFWNLQGMG